LGNIPAPKNRDEFEVAIICALPLEADAVEALFDERWPYNYGKAPEDSNTYSTGMIGRHNVVLAHMPGMGKGNAASVAANCRASFRSIKLALVVGICGGVPVGNDEEEILLGDVIISDGVVQFDLGRQFPDTFNPKIDMLDSLGRPNMEIRGLLSKLKGRWGRKRLQDMTSEHLASLRKGRGDTAQYPGAAEDRLFESKYRHKHQDPSSCATCRRGTDPVCNVAISSTCEQIKCDETKSAPRRRIQEGLLLTQQSDLLKPAVHFGLIASGDSVMKSGEHRDDIAKSLNVIAFEMEGAGVWDNFPCVVIKGVCDYADSHKNKKWQKYAAATAASCMKAFLENWTPAVRLESM
jgi:nucleoside phosphorylase